AEKMIQIGRLNAVASTNPGEFPAAVETYRKFYPNDPSLSYYAYFAHLVARKFDEAAKDIDDMQKELGQDAFFDFLRSRTYYVKKDYDKAFETIYKALPAKRTLGYAGRFYMMMTLEQRQFDITARFLRELEREEGKEMYAVIRNDRKYAEFLRSADFRKWMESPVKIPVDPSIKPPMASIPSAPPPAQTTRATATTPAAKKDEPRYKLNGIFYSKKPSALINKTTAFVGEKVDGATVI